MHTPQQPYIRDDVRALLDMLIAINGPEMSQQTPEEARVSFGTLMALADADAVPLPVIRDFVCPGPAGNIPLRLYDARATRDAGPAIVFFHGGGFVIGDLDSHHSLCTHFAAILDMPLIAVDYRLAPEHPFPAAPDDCEAAARWIATSPAVLDRRVTGLIFTGDSAGGNLTIVTTQALMANPAAVPVIAQAPLYPATGMLDDNQSYALFADGYLLTKATMDWFMDHYALPEGDPRGFCAAADPAATPPTVLMIASLDPLRDEGAAYAALIRKHDMPCTMLTAEGNIHGFGNLRKMAPSSQGDIDQFLDALKAMLAQ